MYGFAETLNDFADVFVQHEAGRVNWDNVGADRGPQSSDGDGCQTERHPNHLQR